MLAGIFIASNTYEHTGGYKDLHAEPVVQNPLISQLPLDIQLDMLKNSNKVREEIHDTITIVHHDTVPVVKYKYKYRKPKKSVEPDTMPSQLPDTLYVPELNIKVKMGEKELMDTILTVGPDFCKNQ